MLRPREYLSISLSLSAYSCISRRYNAITEIRSLNSFFLKKNLLLAVENRNWFFNFRSEETKWWMVKSATSRMLYRKRTAVSLEHICMKWIIYIDINRLRVWSARSREHIKGEERVEKEFYCQRELYYFSLIKEIEGNQKHWTSHHTSNVIVRTQMREK